MPERRAVVERPGDRTLFRRELLRFTFDVPRRCVRLRGFLVVFLLRCVPRDADRFVERVCDGRLVLRELLVRLTEE